MLWMSMIVSGFGGAVLRPHNRGGPRAPDPDDALGKRGTADLSPVSTGAALLALELQVRQK